MEKKLKKYTLPVIAAILTVFALSMTGLYAGSADNPGETFLSLCKKEMTGIGIDKLVVLIAIIALYMKCWRNFCRSCKWITHLIAAMFSVFMLIGMSFSVQGNWTFFTAGRNQILIALLTWAGFFFLFDIVISLLYAYGEKHPFLHSRNIKKFPEFMEKHYLLVAFLLILAGWLPYILIFWPGSVPKGPYIHHCVGVHQDVVPVLYEACKYIGVTPDLYDPIEEKVKAIIRGEKVEK